MDIVHSKIGKGASFIDTVYFLAGATDKPLLNDWAYTEKQNISAQIIIIIIIIIIIRFILMMALHCSLFFFYVFM